ncbi:MAG: hypothetical protein FWE82_01895 [Defluviitaleaceae bacterium]|nr:hypothetical protein [Defluviitaleaceae bacterium]
MANIEDKQTVRELAKRYMELANGGAHAERRARAKSTNDLKPVRPIVWINEIPWHEMDVDGQLRCVCEDELARSMEWQFRSMLFREKYFPADTVAEPYYSVQKAARHTGGGSPRVKEDIIRSDEKNYIMSHHYNDVLDTEESLEQIKASVITADPEADKLRVAQAEELLGGVMPVKLQGGYFYFNPWDAVSQYRGVEPIMIDLALRPDFMHKTVGKFTDVALSSLKQREEQGLLDNGLQDLHCTPAYVSDLDDAFTQKPVPAKGVWIRGTAQLFGDVSPDMHEEFDFEYLKKLSDQCGLLYYGCCEALHNKIEKLKKFKNLRKIGVSPWASVEKSAEQIGGSYVFSHKPNPANVSGKFRKEAVVAEISNVIEHCMRNKCPYEFVLKDISTVTYRPQNLFEWSAAVQETIDKFYK